MANKYDFVALRLAAVRKQPYLAMALFALHPVEAPNGPKTMAVDMWGRVYINPDVYKSYGVDDSSWILLHEAGHWIREHFSRSKHFFEVADCPDCTQANVNLAQEMEINDDLAQDGSKLYSGDTRYRPDTFGFPPNRPFEEYFVALDKDRSEHRHMQVFCGSAAHGRRQPYELPPPVHHTDPGIRSAEGELLREQVAAAVLAHPGNTSGGWTRWAEGIISPPQVRWQDELGTHVRQCRAMAMGMVDYSYTKRSRRSLAGSRVIMPALRRPVPDVAIVIDTSLSMRGGQLMTCVAESAGIIQASGQQAVPVICCDVHAAPVQRVTNASQIELIGGGGTNMGAGIEAAEKLGVDAIIVLTDGATPWPANPPRRAALIVVLIETGDMAGYDMSETVPPYVRRQVRVEAPL